MALEDAVNPMQGVSGPGSFAKRTDLEYKPDAYGEGVAMQQQMQGAPLARSPKAPSATPTEVRQAAQAAVSQGQTPGLFDKTNWPHVPITDGIDMGEGRGSNALMFQKMGGKLSDTLAQMLPYDTTGEIAILYQNALARGN